MKHLPFTPRLIRLKDAPSYVGMDRHRFNKDVRPQLNEIPIGTQGIAFDRLDLDAWVDDYIQLQSSKRSLKWEESGRQVSTKKVPPGKLIKKSSVTDFAKALELVTSKKPKST